MMLQGDAPTGPNTPNFLRGGGEMGALIRAFDWNTTSLGPPAGWPQSLRTAIRFLLNSGHPMYVWWGPDLLSFYNDAYSQSIGPERHPGSLGRPGREVWAEIWDIIGPQIDQVMSGGPPTWHENALVPITRNGAREDVYWTYSYGPIDDDDAPHGVGGVLVQCTETTSSVLAQRSRADETERQRRLFQQAPGFVIIMRGPDHIVDFVNDAHRRVFGSDSWLGKSIREAFPSIEGQGYFEELDEVYSTGTIYQAHQAPVTYQRAPGEPMQARFMNFIYAPVFDDQGQISGIFCDGYDVTDGKAATEALERSEQQLRLVVEASEIGFWDVDMVQDLLYWPPQTKAMFGISPAAFVSLTDFYAGLHPEDRPAITAAFTAAADPTQRALYDVESRTIGKEDGVERWVAAKGRGLFEANRCVRVVGTAIDVTARKHAEAALRDLNETLEQRVAAALQERKVLADVVESTDALILVADLDYRYLAINRASADEFEQVYGVRPKVGDNMLDLLADRPNHQAEVRSLWSRALAGEAFTTIHEFGDPAFDRRAYEIKFNILRDRDGRQIGAFQFVYDVSDRLRDQARLAEAEFQLRQNQKIEAIGQLTGGVAHDFNNLLMVILGGLSMVDRPGAPERRQRILDGMRQAAERGASLSRQLLAFARRQPLKAEPVDLRQQLAGMRDLLDRALRGDVHVETVLADDLWAIQVDPAELELVLLNLCVNARDAMPEGGTISIVAENAPRADGQGDFVRLTVRDTGVGMAKEVLARVFEPFFTTKEIGKGSGLGLPQVYGFAEQSGGSVSVDSTVGRGTAVTLLLPRTLEAPAASAAAAITSLEGLRAPTAEAVLLVEDDDEVAALVCEMLRELGYVVTRVSGAESALGAMANDRAIDLVFSDIMMPGAMNGVQLAQEIRRRRPGLPVLLTSGYAEAAIRETEIEGVAVLPKPYDIDTLARRLLDLLGAT
ncbi:PAS domain-containing protein [Caulobacter hibisci]|uniref:histidine kinase n=1 Tax=Caulobacter hibisci TaxID=2035993 RepID=A0ABS0SZQ8_9CAUL|nr:PAS domain-containing protein [Caulobacter hibisci]MBI1684148.1 PAS domain-containing protein [Caulobacter hibisci]